MLFRKCGCLVAHGKYIFRKCFSVLTCLWCKMISVSILPSNTIFQKTERERVYVWDRADAQRERERERERKKREPIAGYVRASTSPATQRLCTTNLDRRSTSTSNRTQITPFDFTGEPRGQDRTPSTLHPSTSPTSHAFNFAEMALRRHRSHWVHDWEIVGFWWIWLGLMNFFWLGFDEFDRIWWIFFCWVLMNLTSSVFIYWEIVLYICLGVEKLWENVRNNKKMCFLYYFQQHNQRLENIFQSIFWNTTKHLKIFSFSKNSISEKYLFSGKYFTRTKHSLK